MRPHRISAHLHCFPSLASGTSSSCCSAAAMPSIAPPTLTLCARRVSVALSLVAGSHALQVRQIKEKLCYVCNDAKREMRLAEETTVLVASYTLPDGRVIKIGSERFQASEALFQPHLMDIEGGGVAQEVNFFPRARAFAMMAKQRLIWGCRCSTAFKVPQWTPGLSFGATSCSVVEQPCFPAFPLGSKRSSRFCTRRTYWAARLEALTR